MDGKWDKKRNVYVLISSSLSPIPLRTCSVAYNAKVDSSIQLYKSDFRYNIMTMIDDGRLIRNHKILFSMMHKMARIIKSNYVFWNSL